MPPYGEPDWATPSNAQTGATVDTATPGIALPTVAVGSTKEEASNARRNARIFLVFLSLINIGLAAAMGTLGVLTCINTTSLSIDNLTDLFLGIYMVIFALILFLYELCWWQPFPAINKAYRMNFGFMYGLNSKGFFLIFIAFLCLGLADGENKSGVKGLDWVTGIGWLTAGVVHIGIACTWPEAGDVYRPPSAGLTNSGNEDPNSNVV